MAHLLHQQAGGIGIQGLIDGDHHALLEEFADDIRHLDGHACRQFANGDGLRDLDLPDHLHGRALEAMLVLQLGLAHALLAPHATATGRPGPRLFFVIGYQGQDIAITQGVLAGRLLDGLLLISGIGARFDDLESLGFDLGPLLLARFGTCQGFFVFFLFDDFRCLDLLKTGLGLFLGAAAFLFLRQAAGLSLGLTAQFLLRPPAGLFLAGLALLILEISVATGLDLGAARLELATAPGLVDPRTRGLRTAAGFGGCRGTRRTSGGRGRRSGRGHDRRRRWRRGGGRRGSRSRSHWRRGGDRGLAFAGPRALNVDPLLAHLDTDRLGPWRRGSGPGAAR